MLALGDRTKCGKLIVTRLQPVLQFIALAAEGEPKLGQFPLTRGQFCRAVFALAVQIAPKLVAFVDPRLQRRLQRFAPLIERRAKLVQRRFVRGGFGRAFIALPAQGLAKHGKLRLPRLQRSPERLAFGQQRRGDFQVPVDVLLERVAFGFQRVGVQAQGFILVSPEILFIRGRHCLRGQAFQEIGGPAQIGPVVPVGHHFGEPAQKADGLRDIGGLGRHGSVGHEVLLS